MAFVRKKKVKGRSYYYLVENARIRGKVRQKVIKYLGHGTPDEVIRVLPAGGVKVIGL